MSLNKRTNSWLSCCLLGSLLLLCIPLHAEAPSTVFSKGKLRLAPHMDHLVSDKPIAIEDMVAGSYDAQFSSPRNSYLAQDKDNWYRFTITSGDAPSHQWILSLDTAMINEAALVSRQPDGLIREQHTGLKYPFSNRPAPYNVLIFPIQQTGNTTQTYYLKVNTPFQIYFSPTLADYAVFLEDAGINFSFPHLFIGILIGVFAYLFVLSLSSSSELNVGRYAWFVLFAMLIILYVNGFLMRYLPHQSALTTRMWILLHVGLQVSYLLTTRSYFGTATHYPYLDKYLAGCTVVALTFLLLIFLIPYSLLVKIELFFAAQLVLAMTAISCYIWAKERSPVQLFVIGNIGLLIMAAVSTFAAISSIAASDWLVQHGYELGFCWQAILFTWALSLKINALAEATMTAKAESKAKTEFLAKMSHEIRTPMNGVLGMTQLLQSTPVNAEQKHYLNVIESSGKTLLSIINDILDYSKLIAGKVELTPGYFNLEQMLAELNTLFGDMAHNKNISFNIIVSPHTPVNLFGDSIRLRQVLTNLLANAFNFTDHGMVLLKVKALDANNPLILQFSVRDTGIGIIEEDQKHLFQTFSQIDTLSKRRYAGSGLGLSICKQFVELMGGEITVHSNIGQGTEFVFTVAMQIADTDTTPAAKASTTPITKKQLSILVAEDDMVNRDVLAGFLKKMHCNAHFVFNGKEALTEINKPNSRYDLILMDCEMPIMDGMSASRAIREMEKSNMRKAMPIIALTAHTSSSYLKRCKEDGMTDHLCKPIYYDQLHSIILRYTS